MSSITAYVNTIYAGAARLEDGSVRVLTLSEKSFRGALAVLHRKSFVVPAVDSSSAGYYDPRRPGREQTGLVLDVFG